ncbi:MAG: hypothetical protein ACRDTC_05415 [Pseudonocardiaceae bacterium]
MKKRNIAGVELVGHRPPERCGPGIDAAEFDAGDFILVKGHGPRARLIEFCQKLRIHDADRKYVELMHAALIVDRDGTLIEAVGRGVIRTSLHKYTERDYEIYRIKASHEDRMQVVTFARWMEKRRVSCGPLTVVSIALTLLTGSKLAFYKEGEFVCSGLVAAALERAGYIFGRSARHTTPAELARYFDPVQPHHLAA